jgi:hypothetical protein
VTSKHWIHEKLTNCRHPHLLLHAEPLSADGTHSAGCPAIGAGHWPEAKCAAGDGPGRHGISACSRQLHLRKVQKGQIPFELTKVKERTPVFMIDHQPFPLAGAYRIMWGTLMEQYPSLLSAIIVLNCPTSVSALWAACAPFVGEYRHRVRNKQRNGKGKRILKRSICLAVTGSNDCRQSC